MERKEERTHRDLVEGLKHGRYGLDLRLNRIRVSLDDNTCCFDVCYSPPFSSEGTRSQFSQSKDARSAIAKPKALMFLVLYNCSDVYKPSDG